MASLGSLARGFRSFLGGFEGAFGNRRLKGFQPSRAHINTLLAAAGSDVLARARHLVRNNGYASNAVEAYIGNVVGTGIVPSLPVKAAARKAAVMDLWADFIARCDHDAATDFYGVQRRVAREVYIAGEAFVLVRRLPRSSGLSVPLRLQVLPAEMLPVWKTELVDGGGAIRQGIEFNAAGERVAYHFWRRHPADASDPTASAETIRVPASDVLHVRDTTDAGQLRGVSRFAPAIVKLFCLDAYDDAELDRKKVAAMHALFVTTPDAEFSLADELDGDGAAAADRTIDLQPGAVVMLEPGEQVQTSSPADSGRTYEPFQYRTLLQVSAALGIPYAILTNDMVKANYSNTRAALLEFRRRVEQLQHLVLIPQLCQPVIERFIEAAEWNGAITLPNYEKRRREYTAASWLPPRWEWVDPLKDVNAEVAEIAAGLKSRTRAIAERGYDAEQVDEEIKRDRDREKRLGLSFSTGGNGGGGSAGVGHNGGPPLDDEDDPPRRDGGSEESDA